MQNLEFSETDLLDFKEELTDLLDFKEELTDKLLTQFGYECLDKNAKFGVIERSEAKALKQTVEIKRSEPDFKKMFEPEQIKIRHSGETDNKIRNKISRFFTRTLIFFFF